MQMKNINIPQVPLNNALALCEKMAQGNEPVGIGAPPLPARNARTSNLVVQLAAEGHGPYKPVPPPKPLKSSNHVTHSVTPPPYRMPPHPLHGDGPVNTSIPGAATLSECSDGVRPLGHLGHMVGPAGHLTPGLHTHSSKFPIEREVILSSSDKNSKIPILHEYKKRSTGAIAPDAPPKQMAAWGQDSTPSHLMNASQYQDMGYRPQPPEPTYASYPMVGTGAVPRTYPQPIPEPSRPLRPPPKDDNQPEQAKDTPKEGRKISKTYHTIKDMITRFKHKDAEEKHDDPGLNNVADELRKSLRERAQDIMNAEAKGYQMHQYQMMNQSQPNILALRQQELPPRPHSQMLEGAHRALPLPPEGGYYRQGNRYVPAELPQQRMDARSPQQVERESLRQKCLSESRRAASQPQLTMEEGNKEKPPSSNHNQQRRGSHGNIIESIATPIDEKDSDDGGFRPKVGTSRPMDQNYNQNPASNDSGYNQTSYNLVPKNEVREPNYAYNTQNEIRLMERNEQVYIHNPPNLPPKQEATRHPDAICNQNGHGNNKTDIREQCFKSSIQNPKTDTRNAKNTPSGIKNDQHRNMEAIYTQNGNQNKDTFNGGQNIDTNFQSSDIFSSNQKQLPTEGNRKVIPGSAASSDYDKNGGQSSNVDSGRGSAAYSSGRKGQNGVVGGHDTSTESSDTPQNVNASNYVDHRAQGTDSEWVDIVDSELRHILEPQLHGLSLRGNGLPVGTAGGSTLSGSVSSVTPPLPPLSPGGSTPRHSGRYKSSATFPYSAKPDYGSTYNPGSVPGIAPAAKPEYGLDSYNRTGRGREGPLGPSRAGWPGASVQKHHRNDRGNSSKKQDHQGSVKRHLFGLDNDLTSTTTRSLDLDSMLGGRSASAATDSEPDTEGLRDIRSQLEGLENMYSEVLRMLGVRRGLPGSGGRYFAGDMPTRGGQFKGRRHGSVSSLPSSSVSSRPLRDRRRTEERKKVKDIKGINKRFQRLESHVVTLARSVAHLSSEMRTQHLVMQEMEGIRGDIASLRAQASRNSLGGPTGGAIRRGSGPEPLNLTNPTRVKKLTKFFGEDPPLMRLFLKKLGYEKYASLFESERVGMVELPYLGEERLQRLGVPLGPRLRILQEAQISLCKDTTLCIV